VGIEGYALSFSLSTTFGYISIHRHAEGIPRAVNSLCYRSIIAAALKQRKVIDSADLSFDNPIDG